ncbi:MAG: RHS repeat-associated core domain-containing protein, partial [Gammaproteobacteria bacterium]|nr:RHS repeat-associated core domain-containing protein [Gammaproteobacteria bacterium]
MQAEFVYDGDGNRVQQVDHSGSQPVTVTYTNDNAGMSQALVMDDGTTQTYNLFGLDLIEQDDDSAVRVLLADGLGSVRVERGGAAVETLTTFEPFGTVLAQAGTSDTTYGFAGEQHDASGLVYLRARYYNPDLKVFMSRDPFAGWDRVPASQNGYSYSHNNPVNYTDPTGEIVPIIIGGIIIGVITGITWDVMINQGASSGGFDQLVNGFDSELWHNLQCQVNWQQAEFYGATGGIIGGISAPLIHLNLFPPPEKLVHPELERPVDRGNRFHYDEKNGADGQYGPSQIQEMYPDTEFRFPRRGQSGADVEYLDGKHPSEYPNSTWLEGNDFGDFKPNTPNGSRTFSQEINNGKLPEDTTPLPYDPDRLELLEE